MEKAKLYCRQISTNCKQAIQDHKTLSSPHEHCTCLNNIKNTADQYGYTEEYLNHSSYNDYKYILISNKLEEKNTEKHDNFR